MKGSSRFAALLGFGLACAGCGQSNVPSLLPVAQEFEGTGARPACDGPRGGGLFQCDVLIYNYNMPAGANPNAIVGYTPADLQKAYKLPSFKKGKGQIVAVVDAYDNPNVASDLAKYRSEFNLGKANFTKYNQNGEKSNYPKGNVSWGTEIDLDVEMVSASCPKCTIYLIEANNNGGNDLYAAEKEAVKLGARIVTNSWGGGAGEASDGAFDAAGIAYLASAGDFGYRMQDPADYDTVISVGGTNLHETGRGFNETVWPYTGGGCSVIAKPAWQDDPRCSKRTGNDIAAVASDVAEYDTYHELGWFEIGGTSVSSPLMAGALALAENAAKIYGGKTFWQLSAEAHTKDFNTKITGTIKKCPKHYAGTYVCTAGLKGSKAYKTYSGPAGWGSPKGIDGF